MRASFTNAFACNFYSSVTKRVSGGSEQWRRRRVFGEESNAACVLVFISAALKASTQSLLLFDRVSLCVSPAVCLLAKVC